MMGFRLIFKSVGCNPHSNKSWNSSYPAWTFFQYFRKPEKPIIKELPPRLMNFTPLFPQTPTTTKMTVQSSGKKLMNKAL
jgi:hypothetical protein